MAAPSVQEQQLLDLINRLRAAPGAEAARMLTEAGSNVTAALRYFGVDTAAFRTALAAEPGAAPVAWNTDLASSALGHSQAMIAGDSQSHQLPGEAALGARTSAAGYAYTRLGENIFAFADDMAYAHAGFVVDWGYDATDLTTGSGALRADWATSGDGMQDPAGHRVTMLNPLFTEVGISALREADGSTSVGPWVVTQDFGSRQDYVPQLVGVVMTDGDGDRAYDPGEGLGGVTVTATSGGQSRTATSWASGGYQLALGDGSWSVTFAGGALGSEVIHATATVAGANVLLNALSGDAGPATLIGSAGADWLTPDIGTHSVDGGAGSDMLSLLRIGAPASVDLAAGLATAGSWSLHFTSIERATGTVHGDFLSGTGGSNQLRGLGGYDWFNGSWGADSYEGGSGRDMISYVSARAGVTVDLGQQKGLAGMAASDTYDSIERATGSVHADLFYGGAGEEDFRGLGGYDWFVGSGGGKDRYDGGSGYDTVAYTASGSGVVASLALGRGSVGDAARDLYTDIENLTGSNLADTLTGDAGRNTLRGMYGEDRLYGGAGVDRLHGGGSDDLLDGGAGFDYALYDGARSDYRVLQGADGLASVTWLAGGGEGQDLLVGIEAVVFSDEILYL